MRFGGCRWCEDDYCSLWVQLEQTGSDMDNVLNSGKFKKL